MSVSKSVPCSDKKLESDIFGHLPAPSMDGQKVPPKYQKTTYSQKNGKFTKKNCKFTMKNCISAKPNYDSADQDLNTDALSVHTYAVF